MTASATERDVREDVGSLPCVSLRIDFRTFEAFRAALETPSEPPRTVRWFACLARGDCE